MPGPGEHFISDEAKENAMPERWLQIQGDPSVRVFLFQQSRVNSIFDTETGRIHDLLMSCCQARGLSCQGALLLEPAHLVVLPGGAQS